MNAGGAERGCPPMREVRRGIQALGCAASVWMGAGAHLEGCALGRPSPDLEVQIRSVAGHPSGAALVAGSVRGELALPPDQPSASAPGQKDLFVTVFGIAPEPEGSVRQSLLLGGSGTRDLASAVFDPQGDVILAGRFTGTLTFGESRWELPGRDAGGFVVKIDPEGQLRWLRQLTTASPSHVEVHGAAADARGHVIVGGYVDGERLRLDGVELPVAAKFALELDPAGGLVRATSLHYGPSDALPPVVDPAGNAVFAYVSESMERIYLEKRDPAGNQRWRQKLTGRDVQVLTGIAVDSAGDILLAGAGGLGAPAPEGEAGFLAKLDPEGRVVAVRRGPGVAYASVAVDDHDCAITAGSAPPTATWGDGAVRGTGSTFVAKLDAQLRPIWVSRVTGSAGPSLVVGAVPGRAALVAGSFTGSILVGDRPIVGGAGQNAFAAALAP